MAEEMMEELKLKALEKINKALGMELDAELTATYIMALASIISASPNKSDNSVIQDVERVKV